MLINSELPGLDSPHVPTVQTCYHLPSVSSVLVSYLVLIKLQCCVCTVLFPVYAGYIWVMLVYVGCTGDNWFHNIDNDILIWCMLSLEFRTLVFEVTVTVTNQTILFRPSLLYQPVKTYSIYSITEETDKNVVMFANLVP